jgi:hypothetical protein
MNVPEKLVVQDTAGQQARIELNGNTANISAGGNGQTGDILLKDTSDKQRINVGVITEPGVASPGDTTMPPPVAAYWGLRVKNASGANLVQLGRIPTQSVPIPTVAANTVSFVLGGGGHTGIIEVHNAEAQNRVRIGKAHPGDDTVVELRNASNQKTVSLEGEGRLRLLAGNDPAVRMEAAAAAVFLGGHGRSGEVGVFAATGDNTTLAKATVLLAGNGGKVTLRSNDQKDRVLIDGSNGDVWLGGRDANGDIMLYDKDEQENRDSGRATVRLAGSGGQITLRTPAGEDRVFIDAMHGDIWLGGRHANGDIMLFHKDETENRDSAKATIHLNGGTGDIVLRNADCAEDFDIAGGEVAIEPGTVMVIGDDGRLSPSTRPYDRCVAGVISGAANLKPGIVLGRQPETGARSPIALTGRVWCRVDASSAPIETGDLLTTSSMTGLAMKAVEPARAFGAVIGKALAPLGSGQGLIPILVALQ